MPKYQSISIKRNLCKGGEERLKLLPITIDIKEEEAGIWDLCLAMLCLNICLNNKVFYVLIYFLFFYTILTGLEKNKHMEKWKQFADDK